MNKRNTAQRKLIYDTINNSMEHLTIDDIHMSLKDNENNIGIATIYRNLNYLVEAGKIRKIVFKNAKDVYDRIEKKHYHLKCNKCHKIEDINMEYLEKLDEAVSSETGYKIKSHEIIFEGLCDICRKEIECESI